MCPSKIRTVALAVEPALVTDHDFAGQRVVVDILGRLRRTGRVRADSDGEYNQYLKCVFHVDDFGAERRSICEEQISIDCVRETSQTVATPFNSLR